MNFKHHLHLPKDIPVVVSDGLGVDSTAVLELLADLGMRPWKIQFADTGGEKQETYDYIAVRRQRLKELGFPDLDIVRYVPKNFKNWPPYYSLEDNCLTNGTLPSLAFGFKSCSLKWKVAPQDKALEQWQPAIDAWAAKEKVIKIIGYDAGPADMRRRNHAGDLQDPLYHYFYPLIEFGIDRPGCVDLIRARKQPVPPKSSCFFCPAMKPHEVDALPPEKLRRIVVMEARALPRLDTTEGLWRKSTKARPGLMTDYIRQRGLLPAVEIGELVNNVTKEIIRYQEGYAKAKADGTLDQFLAANEDTDYRHTQPTGCSLCPTLILN